MRDFGSEVVFVPSIYFSRFYSCVVVLIANKVDLCWAYLKRSQLSAFMEINDRIHIQVSLKKKKTFAHKRDLNLLGEKTGRRVGVSYVLSYL